MINKLKLFFLAGLVILLSACAAGSTPFIKYDPVAHPVNKIGVIPVDEPLKYMAMDWGQPLGIFGAAEMEEQSNEYNQLTNNSGFQLGKELGTAIIRDLKASGFRVSEASVTREKPAELAKSNAFAKSSRIDAYLDVVINYTGYTTYNIFDRDFKPDLRVHVQLVSAADASVLYSEIFMYGYQNPFMEATELEAPEASYFKDFEALKAGHVKSLEGLKAGARAVSFTIVNKLRG